VVQLWDLCFIFDIAGSIIWWLLAVPWLDPSSIGTLYETVLLIWPMVMCHYCVNKNAGTVILILICNNVGWHCYGHIVCVVDLKRILSFEIITVLGRQVWSSCSLQISPIHPSPSTPPPPLWLVACDWSSIAHVITVELLQKKIWIHYYHSTPALHLWPCMPYLAAFGWQVC